MNILNQPINPGGHPVFPAAKESGHLMPASVRFDGVPAAQPSTAAAGRSHAHSPRWQVQTLRRASSYVGVEHGDATAAAASVDASDNGNGRAQAQAAAAPAAPFQPLTLNFLRSLLDRDGGVSPVADGEGGAGAAPQAPPPQAAAGAAGGRVLRRGAGRAPDRAHRAQDAPDHRVREPEARERRRPVPDRRLRRLLRHRRLPRHRPQRQGQARRAQEPRRLLRSERRRPPAALS